MLKACKAVISQKTEVDKATMENDPKLPKMEETLNSKENQRNQLRVKYQVRCVAI